MAGPSVAAVDRIVKVADPTVRNLQITQCYYELSEAFLALTGREANWCTFATWASKQAGQTIRGEDTRRAFEVLFRDAATVASALEPLKAELGRLGVTLPDGAVREAVLRALDPKAALARSAAAVAAGNTRVFDEIAREFARFLADFSEITAADEARVAAFCATLRDGESPDGQQRLRDAFNAYARARFEESARKRTELLLLANLLVGYHEQLRLQPDIEAAMNAGFGDDRALRRRMLAALVPRFWLRIRLLIAQLLRRPLPLDRLMDAVIAAARQQLRQAVTATMMRIRIGDAPPIALGVEFAPPPAARLKRITLPELKLLFDAIESSAGAAPAHVADWADFDQRIRFVARLFRSHHAAPQLFEAPFSYDQEVALKAGLRPGGRI